MARARRLAALHGFLVLVATGLGGACGSGAFVAPESGLEPSGSESVRDDPRPDEPRRPTSAEAVTADRSPGAPRGRTSTTEALAEREQPEDETPTGGWSNPTTTVGIGDVSTETDASTDRTRPSDDGDDVTAEEAMPDPRPGWRFPVGHSEVDGRHGPPRSTTTTSLVPLTIPTADRDRRGRRG